MMILFFFIERENFYFANSVYGENESYDDRTQALVNEVLDKHWGTNLDMSKLKFFFDQLSLIQEHLYNTSSLQVLELVGLFDDISSEGEKRYIYQNLVETFSQYVMRVQKMIVSEKLELYLSLFKVLHDLGLLRLETGIVKSSFGINVERLEIKKIFLKSSGIFLIEEDRPVLNLDTNSVIEKIYFYFQTLLIQSFKDHLHFLSADPFLEIDFLYTLFNRMLNHQSAKKVYLMRFFETDREVVRHFVNGLYNEKDEGFKYGSSFISLNMGVYFNVIRFLMRMGVIADHSAWNQKDRWQLKLDYERHFKHESGSVEEFNLYQMREPGEIVVYLERNDFSSDFNQEKFFDWIKILKGALEELFKNWDQKASGALFEFQRRNVVFRALESNLDSLEIDGFLSLMRRVIEGYSKQKFEKTLFFLAKTFFLLRLGDTDFENIESMDPLREFRLIKAMLDSVYFKQLRRARAAREAFEDGVGSEIFRQMDGLKKDPNFLFVQNLRKKKREAMLFLEDLLYFFVHEGGLFQFKLEVFQKVFGTLKNKKNKILSCGKVLTVNFKTSSNNGSP